jgi:energy-coupling factor transport system permease protein
VSQAQTGGSPFDGRPVPDMTILRYVARSSPVHRLWAGTKLLGLVAFGVVLSFVPTWAAEAVVAAVLISTWMLARVPWRALPRVPWWLVLAAVVADLVTLFDAPARGHGLQTPLGALDIQAFVESVRLSVLALLLLLGGLVLAWTTPLAEVAPALRTLLGPLRRLRLPVDDLVVAVALAVRGLPMLLDELRSVLAAYQARRSLLTSRSSDGGSPGAGARDGSSSPKGAAERGMLGPLLAEAGDVIVSMLVSTTRRAVEMGEAIDARGGPGAGGFVDRRPGRGDLVALVVMLVALAGMVLPGVR